MVRIDKALSYEVVYDNFSIDGRKCLEYAGRFENDKGIVIIASGFIELKNDDSNKRDSRDITLLIQIDKDGHCDVCQEWNVQISSSNRMVAIGEHIHFGQNKMVTRLSLHTGELAYFTNKNDEELADLKKMF